MCSCFCGPSTSKKRRCESQEKDNQPYIKKPSNAFMLFRKEQRANVVAELNIRDSATVNTVLGQRWNSLSKEEQAKYYVEAEKERRLHAQQFPEWSSRDNYGRKRKRQRSRAPTRAEDSLIGLTGEIHCTHRTHRWRQTSTMMMASDLHHDDSLIGLTGEIHCTHRTHRWGQTSTMMDQHQCNLTVAPPTLRLIGLTGEIHCTHRTHRLIGLTDSLIGLTDSLIGLTGEIHCTHRTHRLIGLTGEIHCTHRTHRWRQTSVTSDLHHDDSLIGLTGEIHCTHRTHRWRQTSTMMVSVIERWRQTSVTSDFHHDVMDGFYSKVNDSASKEGSFFAVCRGKASEGLDFADTTGRGVIVIGLPFLPKLDPRVILKMQFLDVSSSVCVCVCVCGQYLSGQEWYRQQAFMAVNQAIGRVIFLKEDYGAIFLCDQRFKSSDARAQLPLWVRPYVRPYDGFGNVVRDVSQFFRVANKMRPVVEKKTATESCGAVCLPDIQPSGFTSCSHSQSSHTQKAKVLDAHLPSLKRRRLNEHTGATGMPRIFLQYECEVQKSQRRPANLLEALEQIDHHSGGNDDGVVGEEKVLCFL
ncbi:uncharacterized protein LOC121200007 [Toxotes jaculatrix]|uniref:uncharacterized protein LOC121200007 n=1 Tax=Toxotes jaculatrix TaxID=941984 RepID=UPI001B3AFA5B|nr:uncharacterized protein LOC121200007 [Toxotes jaculatrix]